MVDLGYVMAGFFVGTIVSLTGLPLAHPASDRLNRSLLSMLLAWAGAQLVLL
jgi:hypothetical protein